jgi:NADPH:quinone reductase-like Zn-dependent oxidoreductase
MSWIASTYRTGVGSRADFENMNRAIAYHQVRPVVDRVFGFDEVAEAFEYFDAKNYFGKVVISIA